MRKIKVAGIVLAFFVLLLPVAALHYVLPQVDVVKIVNTEVKRTDIGSGSTNINAERQQNASNSNVDVYYIQATEDGRPKVYRNEDNWFYLKINSADQQALAQTMANEDTYVAVRHYGWRVRVFSMFPNTLKIWRVEPDYTHIPVFNTIVLIALAAGLFGLYRVSRKVRTGVKNLFTPKPKPARANDTTLDDWAKDEKND